MQLFNDVKQKAAEFASENATVLLTAGGVVGTVATAVLAGRAGFKAAEIIRIKEIDNVRQNELKNVVEGEENTMENTMGLNTTQKVQLVWLHFVPPVITGTATIGAIVFSHRMSAQKAAALAAAYGLAERNFSEYKDKVSEKLTGPKKQQVVDEIAQDRVNRTNGHDGIIVVEGRVLCFDEPTGRYFESTMEDIKAAVNTTNAEINNYGWATATFFYEELSLPATTWTDEVGWNREQPVELKISTVLKNNKPCLAIDFMYLPKAENDPKHY